jgi:hypothetical protein
MNDIYVRNTIIDFYKQGKSKDYIVNYFYNNNGVFLWGHVDRDKIESKVDKVIDEYENPTKINWILAGVVFAINWFPVFNFIFLIILLVLALIG